MKNRKRSKNGLSISLFQIIGWIIVVRLVNWIDWFPIRLVVALFSVWYFLYVLKNIVEYGAKEEKKRKKVEEFSSKKLEMTYQNHIDLVDSVAEEVVKQVYMNEAIDSAFDGFYLKVFAESDFHEYVTAFDENCKTYFDEYGMPPDTFTEAAFLLHALYSNRTVNVEFDLDYENPKLPKRKTVKKLQDFEWNINTDVAFLAALALIAEPVIFYREPYSEKGEYEEIRFPRVQIQIPKGLSGDISLEKHIKKAIRADYVGGKTFSPRQIAVIFRFIYEYSHSSH